MRLWECGMLPFLNKGHHTVLSDVTKYMNLAAVGALALAINELSHCNADIILTFYDGHPIQSINVSS